MAFSASATGRDNALDTFLTAFSNGVIEIRSGVRPANADTPATGIVLASVPLGPTPFTSSVAGSSSLSVAVQDLAGNANGSATWFRMYDNATTSAALHILDGSVGPLASGADMILDDGAGGTAITTADTVAINTFSVTL